MWKTGGKLSKLSTIFHRFYILIFHRWISHGVFHEFLTGLSTVFHFCPDARNYIDILTLPAEKLTVFASFPQFPPRIIIIISIFKKKK